MAPGLGRKHGRKPASRDYQLAILTDEQSSTGGHDKATRRYTTDGKETTYQWMGNEVKSAAHWEENATILVGKVYARGSEIVVQAPAALGNGGFGFSCGGYISPMKGLRRLLAWEAELKTLTTAVYRLSSESTEN